MEDWRLDFHSLLKLLLLSAWASALVKTSYFNENVINRCYKGCQIGYPVDFVSVSYFNV